MPKGWLEPFNLRQIALFYVAIALPPIWIFGEAIRYRSQSASLCLAGLFVLGIEYIGLRYAFGGNMLLQVLFINFVILFALSWNAQLRRQTIRRRFGLAVSALCCLGIMLIDQTLLPYSLGSRSWLFVNTNNLLGLYARLTGNAGDLKRKPIWSALLNPAIVHPDRGLHKITLPLTDIDLGATTGSSPIDLVFETAPKPETDPAYDHTYWSNVEFSR